MATSAAPPSSRPRVNSSLRALHMPAHLRHLDGSFTNARGQNLSYLALFPPVDTPLRAVVLYLHGIGDHSRRYFHLYERLSLAGFGVLAYDLLSHGASDSDEHALRAHSARFRYFVDDTNEFIAVAQSQLYPKLQLKLSPQQPKMVLAGMSYGTLVSLHTVLSGAHQFAALVLVAPALLVEMTPTLRLQAVFARPLSKLVPKARIVPGVNGDFLCRDQEYVADFEADPLTITAPVTARMGAETLKAMRALEADARVEQADSKLCTLPVLMLMGSEDKVTSLELARRFYSRLAARDKEFKVFDGYFHALFDDPERDAVFEHLDKWLTSRFPVPSEAEAISTVDEDAETQAEAEDVLATEETKPEAPEDDDTPEGQAKAAETNSTPVKEEPVAEIDVAVEEPKAEIARENKPETDANSAAESTTAVPAKGKRKRRRDTLMQVETKWLDDRLKGDQDPRSAYIYLHVAPR